MVSIRNNPCETEEIQNFIYDLKLRNQSLILDIRTNVCETSGLDVTSQEYEQAVLSAKDSNMQILFYRYLTDFLEEKRDEMKSLSDLALSIFLMLKNIFKTVTRP